MCSGQIRRGETSNLTGRSNCEPVKPRNGAPARSGLRERWECRAAELLAKTHVGIVNWTIRCPNSPRSERTACQEGMCNESPEPLAGRLGAPAQRRHRE